MFGVSSFGQYSFSGYTDQPVNLEGVQATISLGNIATISANADVTPTTNIANIAIGSLGFVGAANVLVTTNALTSSLGTMTPKGAADVAVTTNLAGTVASGSVTIVAKAVIAATTNQLTSSVTGPGVITWNDINTGASQTWTNVET